MPAPQLSKKNLKRLQKDLKAIESGIPNEMDPSATVQNQMPQTDPSQQVSLSDLYQTDTNPNTTLRRSPKSSVSNSVYRFVILKKAKIFIRPELPPADIQAQMDVIFAPEIPETRKREISGIAKTTSQNFIDILRGAHREDDLIDLIHQALFLMDKDRTFGFVRKAGIILPLSLMYTSLRANLDLKLDLDLSLKPEIQQVQSLKAPGQSNNDDSDRIVRRPNKRRRGKRPIPSPHLSQSTIPPPSTALSQPKHDAVKTPRPDYTIGLRDSIMTNALVHRGLSEFQVDDFQEFLLHRINLSPDSTQHFLNVRFPILVIEGKAYATGKTVFEAQNQAAVSGACMVNLQHKLIDLFQSVSPNVQGGKIPLAFSICMEGPQIEFWVHYALSENNVRRHFTNIFRTCYGSLQGGLEDFLMDVESLMRWTKDEYLKEIADQLYEVAKHVERG